MAHLNLILHVLLFIILCGEISFSLAIDCYSCTSDNDEGCGETPDGALLILNNNVQSGCSACKNPSRRWEPILTYFFIPVWSTVERSCSTTFSKDQCSNILGYGECYCSTTFCYGSPPKRAPRFNITILLIILTLVQMFI